MRHFCLLFLFEVLCFGFGFRVRVYRVFRVFRVQVEARCSWSLVGRVVVVPWWWSRNIGPAVVVVP